MLVWFVEEALRLAAIPFHRWEKLPLEEKTRLIRQWEQHVGTKEDYVKLAKLKPNVVKPASSPEAGSQSLRDITTHSGHITISYRTAEYLSVLAGQIPWGNQVRRAHACAELGDAINQARLAGYNEPQQTLECSADNTWDVQVKPLKGR